MSARIHPSAFVSPKAELGGNVSVGPCALIEDDVVIGDDCEIHAFASIKRYTRLGKGNVVHSHALLGGIPQDLKFAGEPSRLEIGDGNTIREFASLHRGTDGGGGVTRVGSNNLIMAYCHIAHDCTLHNRIIMSNAATLAGHVTLFDGAVIGGLSAVHQFCRVGRHAFIGGMTGITQDLPPYMMAVGVRAGVHGPNLVGLRRLKLDAAAITAVRSAFRLVWLSGLPRSEALDKAARDFADSPEVAELIAFIRESPRGVLPHVRSSEVKDAP
jgi:UDP-N-acetylglucosamine acyltransferase